VQFSEKKDIDEIFDVFERNLKISKMEKPQIKEIKPTSKSKSYSNTKFPIEIFKKGYEKFLLECGEKLGMKLPNDISIKSNGEKWDLGSIDEFFIEYPTAEKYRLDHIIGSNRIIISGDEVETYIFVQSLERNLIIAVFEVFETNLDKGRIEVESPQIEISDSKEPLKIFIGHGRNSQWLDLKNHLHDSHGFEIEAYEIGSRAGLHIKEILESMLDNSSFALLVLTGEDLDAEGELHARENVIHELGLFQGRLGFKRAIALLENDTNEFSNICGIHQIRFSKDNIKETYGEILATIKREFGE
jgi:predicted nucleotide-binding protein